MKFPTRNISCASFLLLVSLILAGHLATAHAITVHDYTNVTVDPGHYLVPEGTPGAQAIAYTGPIGLGRGGTLPACPYDDTWTGGQYTPTPLGHANAFDRYWFQIISFSASVTYDLGAPHKQVYISLNQDHGPYPEEALEYRVGVANTAAGPYTTLPTTTPIKVFQGGWSTTGEFGGDCNGNGALNDDYSALWQLPGFFRYVRLTPIAHTGGYNEPEIDAVMGVVRRISVDIKPQSCPNPLNTKTPKVLDYTEDVFSLARTKSNGNIGLPRGPVFPAAILGTDEFDVTQIDPTTVMLEGVSTLRWNSEDVSTPLGAGADECDCVSDGPDGIVDLTLKFAKNEVVDALGTVADGDVVVLTITGQLLDGKPFEGTDCVIIRGPKDDDDGVASFDDPSAKQLRLMSYPNPFNARTVIHYALPENSPVVLEIFNVLGHRVKSLVDCFESAGYHEAMWDGTDQSGRAVASGMYFYRLSTPKQSVAKKLILMK